MNLNQFEYLLTVYQEKSITKAAQKLFVSAPAISTAVKQMEEELGYSILIRQPNGIVFTEKGENAITVIQDIQKRISYLYQLKGDLLDIQGEYIIGGTIHFNNAFLMNFLLHMNQKYPHLRLNLQSSDSESIISGIGTGLLDIGMIIMTQIDEANLMREIYRNQLDYLKIASDEMCFVVRKDHPILSENELNLEKLFTYPYICYLENLKGFETSVYKGYKQDKIEMRGDRAEMSDFPLYLNTVAGGLDRRDQTIGGFSFVVKIYAVPVIEIIG